MEIQSREADSACAAETKPQGVMAQVVVGIGSSAGGIEVLLDLMRVIPVRPSQAFLLCQHLSPGYKSLLPDLISRHTRHTVQEAFDGAPLVSGAFYMLPSRYFITASCGRILLRERKKSDPFCFQPIDQLFKSLAVEYGEGAIAVVLSGTGSDGVAGALEVRRRGGHVIIQDLGSAAFQGMPQNVKNSAAAPLELSIHMIPSHIEKITRKMPGYAKPTYVDLDRHFVIDGILEEIRSRFEADFFSYDLTKVREKINQRSDLVCAKDLEQYLNFFKSNQLEQESLYHELRSRNLEFYSYPESLERLRLLVFPLLADECKRKNETVIRVWVLGCGTGEESYTLAFMLQDFIEEHQLDLSFKIFSTDLDLNSINSARFGVYPAHQVLKLQTPWLRKYFSIDGDRALVKQAIRDKVAFSRHCVFSDAPFPSIHLVSCRNFINMLKHAGQEKVVKLIKYSINSGGFLFIGDNDFYSGLLNTFSIYDKHRVFFIMRYLSCSIDGHAEGAQCLLPEKFDCLYKDSPDAKVSISKILLKRENGSQQIDLNLVMSQLESENESLQAKNEEQQATLDMAQRSNEELQAVNQELQAMNAEFQFRIKEMSETASELQNVCNIAKVGTIVIGLDFKIIKFNNFFQKIIHLANEDIGRSLVEFSAILPYDFFYRLKRVVENHQDFKSEMTSQDGSLYLMSLSPYRNHRLEIKGVFGVFIDISHQKEKLNEANTAKVDFEILSELSQELVIKLTPHGSILECNRRCENLFQISEYPDYRFF